MTEPNGPLLPPFRSQVKTAESKGGRWWRYAVIRGEGIPPNVDGKWYDLDEMDEALPGHMGRFRVEATNQWEQRDDGAVAVVYRLVAG